ncbi:STAS domain-containing protein [Streptomyces sp. SID13666]|uniref:STAS domain-containing protein n=1 Tax=unclassified Streptomyces TaxID=2593676 RepID=UPI0013C1854A|nr:MULTISPECIES: STAS domain-containing protein [unclassified Streptomyces]NEA54661.1 STAS domain-containing protein [Streptomyces sp. SID13666]NEA70450.1 STAS domain-containing protein [Streptomyces sp. SID13588]
MFAPVPRGARLTVSLALGEPSVLTVAGEVDLDGVGPVRDAVDRALDHHPHLVFDLAGVSFGDSTFLSTLLQARLHALERSGSVILLAPSTPVLRVLTITGALELFPVMDREERRQTEPRRDLGVS